MAPELDVRVGIIGLGRLGAALAAALDQAGVRPLLDASRRGGRDVVPGEWVESASLTNRADLVVLAVPDGAIEDAAAALPWRAGQVVAHTSGARSLGALADAARDGARIGAFHPLQTFPAGLTAGQAADRFRGIVCGIEGEGRASELLEALTRSLGARVLRLEGVDRAAYHAAAVLASNDVVALAAAATRAWEHAGLPADQARGALAPLILATAEGIGELPLNEALTGPLARGDVDTIERHLAALAGDAALADLYRRLAVELLRLDLGHPPAVREALLQALTR